MKKTGKQIVLSLLLGSFILTSPVASLAASRMNGPADRGHDDRTPHATQQERRQPSRDHQRSESHQPRPDSREEHRQPASRHDDRQSDSSTALKVGGAMLLLGLLLGSTSQNSGK